MTGRFIPVRRRSTPGAHQVPGPGLPRAGRLVVVRKKTCLLALVKRLVHWCFIHIFLTYRTKPAEPNRRENPTERPNNFAPWTSNASIRLRGQQSSKPATETEPNPREKPSQAPPEFPPIAGQHIDQNPRPAVIQRNRKCSPNCTRISRPTKNLSFFLPPMWGSVTGAPGQGTVFASILGAPVATNCGACLGLASGGGGPRFGWALGPWFWYVGGTGLGAFSGPVWVRPGDRFWCAFRDRLGCAL